ncbi:hypothetical protein [Raineya orbicola]|jgi:hypothetical protein|uniref:Uncharacterized protein n=1 Tax=Raineya orbicola TaxID=2016530 RepID=A0A2N3IJF6_9BACT|nr:hypothetical protein [Raineya orbicola]PKQ70436.1 hypothetical protein Rain11_0519 [Raineya orbicola]
MEFIVRFDKNDNTINKQSEARKSVYAVQLTDLGIKYVQENNPKEQYRMYVEATEKILRPIVDDLFCLLYREFESISVWEFMFIFSDESLSINDKVRLIKQSRKMTNLEHIQLRFEIQQMFKGINKRAKNKNDRRDFSNWYNETLQILHLLNQTIYFKTFRKTVLMLSLSQEALEFRVTRSENQKIEALLWHKIEKRPDYDLHHIFPLEYASCKKDLDLIDDFRNLIYISKKLHKKIPFKNNLFVEIAYEDNRLLLRNPLNKADFLDITEEAVYEKTNLKDIIEYNKKILQEAVISKRSSE